MTLQNLCARHGRYVGRKGCPVCKRERARRPKRATAAEKIRSSARWKTAERETIDRDGGQCTYGLELGDGRVMGGRCPVITGLQAHHRVPIEAGGAPFALSNLRTLCATHHARAESALRQQQEEQRV